MSFYATETYLNQSGGLATYSHCAHQKQLMPHNGGAVLHSSTKQQQVQQQQTATTVITQAQQQPIVTIELQQEQILPQQQQLVHCPVAALLSSSLLSNFNGYDVLDNKTNESIPIYIQKHQRYIMNDIFHREDERLKTFDTWPLDWMDKYQLAQTGMFYTGEDDKVKCYFCEVEIGRWEHSDHPVSEHLRWFPNCPLLRRRTTNNVPMDAEALDRVLPPVSYDICGANETGNLQISNESEQLFSLNTNTSTTTPHTVTTTTTGTNTTVRSLVNNSASSNSLQQTYYPEYPEYAIEAARLRSFAEWPRHMKQKPEQLAEAGFFYIGTGDRVKCFSCGGGLKDWADNDEPWEQHTLWMSKCRFLKLMKGQNYIDTVLTKQQKQKQKHEIQDKQITMCPLEQSTLINGSLKIQGIPIATNALNVSISTVIASGIDTAPVTEGSKQEATSGVASVGAISDLGTDKRATMGSIPEEKLCKICYADEYNTAFLPCGHVVACAKCASSVTKCPLCRKSFTDVMRVYFS